MKGRNFFESVLYDLAIVIASVARQTSIVFGFTGLPRYARNDGVAKYINPFFKGGEKEFENLNQIKRMPRLT